VAIFSPDQPIVIVLPVLEGQKLEKLPFDIKAFTYGEDPTTWHEVFKQAVMFARLDGSKAGIEPRQFRVLELRLIENAASRAQFNSAEEIMATCACKRCNRDHACARHEILKPAKMH
jgi:hypothetical protein